MNNTTCQIDSRHHRLAALCLALLCAIFGARTAHAFPCAVVTNSADSGPGTLRDTLAGVSDGAVICFDLTAPATILLTSGELLVTNSVTILGPGVGNLAIDGNGAGRVFHVTNAVTVVIAGVTVTNGATSTTSGGGIYNEESTLTLSNCTITGNSSGFYGGGIANDGIFAGGALTLVNCTVSGNAAATDGGGVANVGIEPGGSATLVVNGSTFSGNLATNSDSSNGGGLVSIADGGGSATATINTSTIIGNNTNDFGFGFGSGGGIGNIANQGGSALMTVAASTISGNGADFGAGVLNSGQRSGSATLTLITSTVSNNFAGFGGGIANLGGIFNESGSAGTATLTVSNSSLTANTAFSSGSGIYSVADQGGTTTVTVATSTFDSNGVDPEFGAIGGDGGAISNFGDTNAPATVTVTYSTFSRNQASYPGEGGAILNDLGTVTLMNSTISSNSASSTGAIRNQGITSTNGTSIGATVFPAVLTVLNCTLSDNSAEDEAGGIYNVFGTVNIGSTILKASPGGGQNIINPIFTIRTQPVGGRINTLCYNLSTDTGDDWFFPPCDQVNTDPLLGPLQDNGGPTFTQALLPGSPAIDQGSNFVASATDQRGFPRTVDDPAITNHFGIGDGTDVGAFELQNFPPMAKCKDVTVTAGAGCAANASIDNGSFDPDAGDTITLSQSPAGPYPVGQTVVTLTAVDNHGNSNSCQSTVTVTPSADLAIAKAVANGQGKPGQALIYTIGVNNAGPCSASGVVATDVVPLGSTYVSASPTPSSAPAAGSVGTVIWNLGSLSSGGSKTLSLTVKVSTKGNPQIVNTATVTSTSFDPNLANNSATVSTTRKAK